VRDCVQFVPFSQFASSHYSELAKCTLAEVPTQLLTYFRRQNLLPNPPLVALPTMSTTTLNAAPSVGVGGAAQAVAGGGAAPVPPPYRG
jgi:hypothetical protein